MGFFSEATNQVIVSSSTSNIPSGSILFHDSSNFLTLTDTESGTEYTFDPDLYPPGYRSLYNIESGNDYSTAPPFPLLKDFKTYAEYKTAFDAHKDGPYQEWLNSFPKTSNGTPILPKLNTDTGTIKTTTSNQNVTNTTANTSNETTHLEVL